jgi:hypothetical protein
LEKVRVRNHWMSLWLIAADSRAAGVRGLWTAELHRQRTAMANEMVSHTMDFWVRTWMAPIASHKSKRGR